MVSQDKFITWNELERHCIGSDCWIVVRGKVYNVTSWIPKHPGGYDTIVLNGGRDATQLFEAYHPVKVFSMLDKYFIGNIEGYNAEHPVFPPMSPFYLSLKQKVENYFTENKMSPRYGPQMLWRSLFLVTLAFVFHYLATISVAHSWSAAIAYSIGVGVMGGWVSFMPVHEGSHAALTEYPFMWRLLGATLDIVNGASFYTWCHQHFLGHHPYTNVTNGQASGDALDPDVCTNDPDIRRIKPNQTWYNRYRFQQLYVPVLYGLLGLKYRINDFLIMFVLKRNGSIRLNPPSTYHWTLFFAGKLFFLVYRVFLPIAYLWGINSSLWWRPLVLLAVSDSITSYMLAFVFQVNHVIGVAKWPTVDTKTGLVDMDWAKMQVETTIDYAHDSWLTTFATGALNYQVTHHLFPQISQIHYPALGPIIRDHCAKHGVKYTVLPSFWAALKAHIGYLAQMGAEVHEHAF